MADWTPAEINTALWLDAADASTITASGGLVSQWVDKSGNDRHATQGTSSAMPLTGSAAVNGLNAISFDGASDYLSVDALSSIATGTDTPWSVIAVCGSVSPVAYRTLLGFGNPSSNDFFHNFGWTDTGLLQSGRRPGDVALQKSVTGVASQTSVSIDGYVFAGSLGQIYINGALSAVADQDCAAALSLTTASIGALRRLAVGNYCGLTLAEIIVVAGVPTTETRQYIEGYLAHKWGLAASLPADHPYKSSAPSTAVARSVVGAVLNQAWGLRLGADLLQRWSDAPVVKGLLTQPWGNAGVIRAQLVQRWRDMVTLRARLDQPWAIMESLLVTLEQPWAITSGPVQSLLAHGWNIRDVEQVLAVLHQPWSIASDGTVLRYTVEVVADGQPVRVSQINIEGGYDDSGDVLTCEIHLATEAEYLLCPFGAELVVTITSQEGTDSFVLVVTSPKPSEAHGNNAWVVEAMSPAVMLGAPYAEVIDGELSGLASDIVATLAGDIALSWETVDWHIPAATWIASGETPLALLKTLAAAVGALVQSDPDGTIAIRPKWPISLPNWATATPGRVFVETLDCFKNGSTPEHRYGYNRFLVSNQSSSADSLTLEQADISSAVKEVRGYQVPWDGLFDLTHTGGSWVVIEPLGIEERDETETIEFVAGAGSTRYPIHGLVSVAWQQTNLGTITTAEDGSLTASISGQSLCEITYTTRCRLWKVEDTANEQLQLVAEL